jgi:hypothetical protein
MEEKKKETLDEILERVGRELELQRPYLDEHIFYGLTDLNTGFDALTIKYFSKEEFRTVLERVEKAGVGIHGIEPWREGEYYDVWTCSDLYSESTDPAWYWLAFEDFASRGVELQYSASYYVPAKLIMEQ